MILVAPTEPAELKVLGPTNSLPEQYGCDFLFVAGEKWYGVQRKEYGDFVASVYDGRLAKELAQMDQVMAGGGQVMLIIEGQPTWSLEGNWVNGRGKRQSWTIAQHHGYLWAVQRLGVWVDCSTDVEDTGDVILHFRDWAQKPKHQSLKVRPGPVGAWGNVTNREWLVHLLQGFPGVGVQTANDIIETLGCPIGWTVGVEELVTVKGIGKKTAERLIGALTWKEMGNGEQGAG